MFMQLVLTRVDITIIGYLLSAAAAAAVEEEGGMSADDFFTGEGSPAAAHRLVLGMNTDSLREQTDRQIFLLSKTFYM